ncbi:hypothetical protein [Sinosporangium album]|uniref:hypothetical protein n=1 Tax=Sinosporangium album TaxID=504805 RepID=UPI00115F9B03|nr:hypothetical protein [Sinosporangium album]
MQPDGSSRPGLRPGPKPRLSRQKIINAAIDLGIEQVTVNAVAAVLNAAPGSLYRYIDSLDDLIVAAVETVFSATPLPPLDGGWRTYLETEAATRFDLLQRYAGLLPESGAGLAGAAGRRFEELVRGLVSLGFDLDEAVLAVDAVIDLIHDGASQIARLHDPRHPERLSAAMTESLARYSPDVRAAVERIIAAPKDHLWRKLAILLDGIAARPENEALPFRGEGRDG